MLVVVAAPAPDASSAAEQLRRRGAADVTDRAVGDSRILVYGGPFNDRDAVQVAAAMRSLGWPADVRPEGGGHLTVWQTHTRAIEIAHRLWVCFPWSEFDRDQPEPVVEIDPGRAFGTGAHPTTKLLLQELAARIGGGEQVLDVGCGSGVLALAAARLGAAHVTAVDISPEAIEATKANARRNGLGKMVEARATPVTELTITFDVIVANIHAETLIQLAAGIQSRLAPAGWLAVSGLSPAQTSRVESAYRELTVIARPTEEDWIALVAGRE